MSPKIHNVPLPYTTLLASSWTTDYGNPLEPYASGISFLPADMESSQGGQFLNNFLRQQRWDNHSRYYDSGEPLVLLYF